MREKGFSLVTVIVLAVILFLAAAGGAYYYLKLTGKSPYGKVETTPVTTSQETPISASKDSATINKELNATTIDSVDADIKSLEASASSL